MSKIPGNIYSLMSQYQYNIYYQDYMYVWLYVFCIIQLRRHRIVMFIYKAHIGILLNWPQKSNIDAFLWLQSLILANYCCRLSVSVATVPSCRNMSSSTQQLQQTINITSITPQYLSHYPIQVIKPQILQVYLCCWWVIYVCVKYDAANKSDSFLHSKWVLLINVESSEQHYAAPSTTSLCQLLHHQYSCTASNM